MGFFDSFVPRQVEAAQAIEHVDAASLQPYYAGQAPLFYLSDTTATRAEAMSVPTINRACSIIQTIGSLPMHVRNEGSGERVQPQPRVINQPDPRIAGSVFWSWIVSDLFFHPTAYAFATERYSDTGRIRAMERIAPERVTIQTNAQSTEITNYMIDGKYVDANNLVVFAGCSEGLLSRAGRTIKAAAALESAALDFALNPVPQMVLSSNGTSLPADRVAKLKQALLARTKKAFLFLNADVKLDTLGYDPKSLQMNEARNYVALELARATGIPAYFVDAQQSTFTYSNALDKRRDLIDFAFRNYLSVIEQRMSFADFVPAGQTVRFDLDDFLRGSLAERIAAYKTLFDIGALSIDEIREEEDLIS
jgi:HK97 family phage portal protein